MRDKDYLTMVRGLAPLLDAIVVHAGQCAPEPHGRPSWSAAAEDKTTTGRPETRPCRPADAASARARELAGPRRSSVKLVGGSLYLLEDLRDVLAPGL